LDFTVKTYRRLLDSLVRQGYAFQTFTEFLEKPEKRSVILRHDVEARYGNALVLATIQHESGIKGTYYFRFLPDHFDKEIIKEIASIGHEIGYHYDDLSHSHGDHAIALKRFEKNLNTLREIAPVKTICMEGAPLSKWDNRDLWQQPQASSPKPQTYSVHASPLPCLHAHYRDYGIIGEPYFDIDFSRVLYLTDTGRRWDGDKVSVRDKVGNLTPFNSPSPNWRGGQGVRTLHSTSDIISAANSGILPDQIMFTFHPQRWTDRPFPWIRELVMQNVKNVAKRIVLRVKY
jgi:hypothetical protein